ncbi:hypothetical protein AOLI_G00200620 [Acnodon oligacanthus]
MERVVASQLQDFLSSSSLYEPFQSGFRTLHSTETALVKVLNDLLLSTDAGLLNILILLDLTAAFDTVNHNILISRLSSFGITGLALQWLQSYLADRHQYISMGSHKSGITPVDHENLFFTVKKRSVRNSCSRPL